MKIVLIYPPQRDISIYNTPTGLLYIATVLKNSGYNVRFIDCSVEPHYRDTLDKEILDADILGVYAMSVHVRYIVPELLRLKKLNKRMKIVWGGPHAMLFPEQTAKSDLADIVVRSEGEDVMLEIIRGYESANADLHKIKGISFKDNGKVITTADRDFVDINSLPFVDWTFIRKEVMNVIRKSIIRVQASRGCPYSCAFCINVVTKNGRMRYRNPDKVVSEIEYLYREYGIKRVGFRDEVFMSDRRQVKEIAQGILNKGIKISWLANPRVEYLRESYIDDVYLKLLADSGCDKLSCGAESGSQRILDLLRKNIKVEDVLNFVRRTKKFHIVPVVSFMTGVPTETDVEQFETLRLIRKIASLNPEAFIAGPQNFRPYPGGQLYDMCVKQYGLKTPDSLEEWANADTLGGISPPWIKRMYFNQYIWRSIYTATYYTPVRMLKKLKEGNMFKKMLFLCFLILSKLRFRYLFYKFPFEFHIFDWYYRFIKKSIPQMS